MEYGIFAAILLGVLFNKNITLAVFGSGIVNNPGEYEAKLDKVRLWTSLGGLMAMSVYKTVFGSFSGNVGLGGLGHHLQHEWVLVANLLALLTGFEVVAHHFKSSKVPDLMPAILPDDWKGGFVLLIVIFLVSGFMDNIAAAILGAGIAKTVFRDRLHTGYLVAIVAAANAGGSGSVVGDTTTTMIWLDGQSPLHVVHAYVPALIALMFFGVVAARQQHKYQPILKDPMGKPQVDIISLMAVGTILALAISTNVAANLWFRKYSGMMPWIGMAVWLGILLVSPWRAPHWQDVSKAGKGAIFLVSLVLSASMVPVSGLPQASWESTFALGFISSIFDNIPLTALALNQGGYDWAFLAFAVGFGGSMIYFGSSAGVSVSNDFPQAKDVRAWVKNGWHVPVAYIIASLSYKLLLGWDP